MDAEKVYIKTFGGFDLYYRGKEIDFSNAKAKELLAVLVDQGGREVSLHEMAQILSDGEDDLWQYSMDDGRNMQKAVAWLFPYIADKSSWPFAEDVMFWDEWPVAQPALLFSICNTSNRTYLEIWKSLEHFPTNDEVIRNLPIRHPLLWL